jgi:hypothetical protein
MQFVVLYWLHMICLVLCAYAFVLLDRSRVKLLDMGDELKRVTLILNHLIIGECVFDDLMVLFDEIAVSENFAP